MFSLILLILRPFLRNLRVLCENLREIYATMKAPKYLLKIKPANTGAGEVHFPAALSRLPSSQVRKILLPGKILQAQNPDNLNDMGQLLHQGHVFQSGSRAVHVSRPIKTRQKHHRKHLEDRKP
jgi:hypothetical protein